MIDDETTQDEINDIFDDTIAELKAEIIAATIERCAQVVHHLIENSTPNERGRLEDALSAIHALKE